MLAALNPPEETQSEADKIKLQVIEAIRGMQKKN